MRNETSQIPVTGPGTCLALVSIRPGQGTRPDESKASDSHARSSQIPAKFRLFFFWQRRILDNVHFGQRGRTLSLSTARNLDFGQRGFCHGVDFSVEMSGSGCSASGEPTPTTTPSSCSFTSPGFRGNSSNRNHSEPRERSKPYTTTTSTRRTVLAVACSLLADPGRRPCAIFLTSHSSATRHQWLNLFSTRHECFTSDVGLTRTRLVSCILLTSLLSVVHTAHLEWTIKNSCSTLTLLCAL